MPQVLAAAAGLAWPIETTSVGEGVLGLIINLSKHRRLTREQIRKTISEQRANAAEKNARCAKETASKS